MQLHPACENLAFLVGTWRGSGEGEYPTITSFRYDEEVVFGHVGKPFLSYSQKTKDAASGQPLHAETGYLRAGDGGRIEFVIVQPSGIVESHHGLVNGQSLDLELHRVETTLDAKSVTNVRRVMHVDHDEGQPVLKYTVAMAAVGHPLQHHLQAALLRQQDT